MVTVDFPLQTPTVDFSANHSTGLQMLQTLPVVK